MFFVLVMSSSYQSDVVHAYPEEKKGTTRFNRYVIAIIVLSLNTLLLYFYYNAFAPILSMMAKDYGFTDEERDYKIGSVSLLI